MALALLSAPAAFAAQPFALFVEGLWPAARSAGVSRGTFDAAFKDVAPDPRVIGLARAQPEFNQAIWSYVNGRVGEARVRQGRQAADRYETALKRIETTYGVDRYTILAIWAMESNFGTSAGSSDIIRSLATLACCTARRPDYFRDELIAALQILEAHDIEPRSMTGSWAGAMGQTQFMPSSFLRYAADADRDGRRDIWRSAPDALASIANYLSQHGWEARAPWGYEVRLPRDFDYRSISRLDGAPASEWAKLGLERAGGGALPGGAAKGWLFLPAGARGPAFLTFQNYWVIKSYNVSDAYTLSVGHLADRIRGGGPIAAKWPVGDRPLGRARLEAMQKRLKALGFEIDTLDGKVGPSTRAAIRAWQTSVGLTADGYPTAAVLQRMGVPD
jgi:membrane-bound lytic murein transglycosylase B